VTATYVYAVVPASRTATKGLPAGGREDDLRLVVDGPVAAIVTTVASADLTGTADDLMAHASVVDELNASGVTLPVRFGVVLDDDDAVVDHLLRRHRDRLNELLVAVEGRVELRLRARYDRDALFQHILRSDRKVRELSARVRRLPEHRGHADRVHLGELVAAAVENQQRLDAAQLLHALDRLAVRYRVLPAPADLVALNAAFLVDAARQGEFATQLRASEDDLAGRVSTTLVGPLPPWDFVDLEPGGS
jgi:Gas vesicle synthesis protein GvpL/GvpF